MRFRVPLLLAFVAIGAVSMPHLAHAAIPFFGPIIPEAIDQCPLGWGAVIPIINNIIQLALTLAIVAIAPLMLAWAGFLMMTSSTSIGSVSKARSIIWNTILGIVIALAAWMIVNAILVAVTQHGVDYWSRMISTGGQDACLAQSGSLSSGTSGGNNASVVTGTTGSGSQYLSFGTQSCDASKVSQWAQSGGYSLTPSQASTLACLAKPESSCGTKVLNYNWGKGSSSAGAFQVSLQTNGDCYNNAVCSQAASVSGPLNCATAFSGGNVKADAASQALAQKCVQAAANQQCSTVAAACVLQKQGYSAWTADPNSTAQKQCIASVGP